MYMKPGLVACSHVAAYITMHVIWFQPTSVCRLESRLTNQIYNWITIILYMYRLVEQVGHKRALPRARTN